MKNFQGLGVLLLLGGGLSILFFCLYGNTRSHDTIEKLCSEVTNTGAGKTHPIVDENEGQKQLSIVAENEGQQQFSMVAENERQKQLSIVAENEEQKKLSIAAENEGQKKLNVINTMISGIDTDRQKSNHRIANKVLTDYNQEIASKFKYAVENKLKASHPKLIAVVRQMMDSPSAHLRKTVGKVVHTPQSEYVVANIFHEKKGGFFVEAGGLDGERSSNTQWIEHHLGWTGLLVEPDPYFYTQLLGKNRKSWSINACISPSEHAEWLTLKECGGGCGKIAAHNEAHSKWATQVPCIPMESLLLALNRTSVDFFSLDVEGLEIEILKSMNHTKLDIQAWTIEYDKVGRQKLQDLMESLGYSLQKKIDFKNPIIFMFTKDLVFVKNKL